MRIRRWTLIVVVGLALSVLGGCGGEEDDESVSDTISEHEEDCGCPE